MGISVQLQTFQPIYCLHLYIHIEKRK